MAERTEADRHAFTGWFKPSRPGGRWIQACQSSSWDSCWDLLNDFVSESGDSVVLASGKHPDEQTSGRKIGAGS